MLIPYVSTSQLKQNDLVIITDESSAQHVYQLVKPPEAKDNSTTRVLTLQHKVSSHVHQHSNLDFEAQLITVELDMVLMPTKEWFRRAINRTKRIQSEAFSHLLDLEGTLAEMESKTDEQV